MRRASPLARLAEPITGRPTTLLSLTPTTRETAVQRRASTAADTLFTRHGVTPVTMDDIAAEAGLALDELTAAYPSKRALVVAVLQRWHGAWRRALDGIARASEDPRDEVLGVFGYLEQCFADEGWRGCAFINGHAELGRIDPAIAELAQAHFTDVEAHLTQLCARAGVPSHVAQALSLLVEGARVGSAVQRSAQPARAARLGAAMLLSVYDAHPTS